MHKSRIDSFCIRVFRRLEYGAPSLLSKAPPIGSGTKPLKLARLCVQQRNY